MPDRLIAPSQAVFGSLLDYYLIMGGGAAAAVLFYMVYNVVKYRDKSREQNNEDVFVEEGHSRHGARGSLLVLTITVSILAIALIASFQAIGLYYYPPATGPHLTIKVYAFRFGWNFTYPNGYSDIGVLRVPANTTIILNVTSKDVFHSLGIPGLDVKADAIPGFWNTLWFNVPTVSNYTIRCYELCGPGHAYMTANLSVISPQAFSQWYSSVQNGGA
jgi:cytochrome c oxidase subunit 2